MNPLTSWLRCLRRAFQPTAPIRRSTSLRTEALEDRAVPAVIGVRSFDGSGNNLSQPTWGQAGIDYIRIAPAAYSDGISAPSGSNRPSARVISNAVADQSGQDVINDRAMSAMIYAWGQFIDHDLDLTNTGTGSFPVSVPAGDPSFDPNGTGTKTIPLTRSSFDPVTGTSTSNPRQQVNSITAWLDGSMIYGSDQATANSLRTFQGGKLKTSSGNLLPTDAQGNFVAGDVRVNENPELTSLHTLFMREHNRVADQIARSTSGLSDEQIYQMARAWVIAEVQAITYNEWLPTLLGQGSVGPYRGYNPSVNPGISNEFATAGFRFGHSLLGDDIEFLGNDGKEVAPSITLAQAFFNPSILKTHSVDSLLKYLSSDPASEVDTKVVDSVRNFLFGAPGSGGLDLASLNIQRGRDHGLSDYNTTRAAYGLPKVTDFSQITSNPDLQAKLKSLYGSVNNIDLWVGALAEDHVPGGSVGPTVRAILMDQFNRLRAGDRFWYENAFSGPQLDQLRHTSLSTIIRQNTMLTNLQQNVFTFQAGISGVVFGDGNKDGKLNPGERTFPGRTVQLIDATTGEVIATTKTDAMGKYNFGVKDGVRTGSYLVKEVLPSGAISTTPSGVITITQGDTFVRGVDQGSYLPGVQPPTTTTNTTTSPTQAPTGKSSTTTTSTTTTTSPQQTTSTTSPTTSTVRIAAAPSKAPPPPGRLG